MTVLTTWFIAYHCALLGPMKEARLAPAHGYQECIRVYDECARDREFLNCVWYLRNDERMQMVPVREAYGTRGGENE